MLDGIDRDPSIEIEATATLTDVVTSGILRKNAPVVSQSLENAATPAVRNVGTAAGNLLQRPRCWYYRNEQFHCLKKGGHMCYAENGENRYHAIFGPGACHIVHPSNLATALFVCDAKIHVMGGTRDTIKIADLFHLPNKGMDSVHNLEAGEVVTHITLSARPTSGFYAIKEKQSFDWPLVMVAVSLDMDGGTINDAEVCAGAVAPVPWPLPKVAEALKGVDVNDDSALRKACESAAEGAKAMRDNAYKITLLPVTVRRAVLRAVGKLDPKEAA
jgi:xanthine dehydrogenase YagS FAD-binding subunit